MPRWRAVVRRCLEYSLAQRRRAELPECFRKTLSSYARPFRAGPTAARCGVRTDRCGALNDRD